MNAKLILLAALITCASGAATVWAQNKLTNSELSDARIPTIEQLSARLALPYDCTLTYREDGKAAPVRVSATSPEEAQRNAVALATPTGASCTAAKSNTIN